MIASIPGNTIKKATKKAFDKSIQKAEKLEPPTVVNTKDFSGKQLKALI